MPPAGQGSKKGSHGVATGQGKAKEGGPGDPKADAVKPPDFQLHPTFPSFQWWVVDKLVGIYANDRNNVVVQIVGRWIDENQALLASKEISHQEWRNSQKPQGVVKSFLATTDKPEPPEGRETHRGPEGDNSTP
jgi:hypothetical protein